MGKYKKCKRCLKEFHVYPYQLKAKQFCSRKCANISNASKNSSSKKAEKNPMYGRRPWNYKGGTYTKSGSRNVRYRLIYVNGKQIREHVHIMQTQLGRKLKLNEVVHHKNGNGLDNRIENLELMTKSQHSKYHSELIDKDNRGRFIGNE